MNIYQDAQVIAAIKEGVVSIQPLEESIPSVKKAFEVANAISIIYFEALGAQGTNIIQQASNVFVIPRKEGDGFKLTWKGKDATPESLSDAQQMITEALQPAPETQEKSSPEPKTEEAPAAEGPSQALVDDVFVRRP